MIYFSCQLGVFFSIWCKLTIFLSKVADNSTLYGCCVLVEEIVQKPSGLISMMSESQSSPMSLSRHILTTRRCYCILSRLPYFELHFGVLNRYIDIQFDLSLHLQRSHGSIP